MKKILPIFLVALMFGAILSGCTSTPKKFDVSVFINGAIFGRVNDEINGTYTEGDEVTIVATPYNEDQVFFCWIHDNQVVSNQSSFTFEVNQQTAGSYVALFNCADLEYVYIDSFEIVDNASNQTTSQDRPISLVGLNISLGYNQNDLVTVYSETTTSQNEQSLYAEAMPFTFDKTRNLYIRITLTYTRENLQYTSQTTIINPAVNIGETVEAITAYQLSKATCVSIEDLELDQQQPSTISINFKPLSQFTFPEIEPEE